MTIKDMLIDDDAFLNHFCSEMTSENLRGIPVCVLRKVVSQLHEVIEFSALASPRRWTPDVSVKTIVVAGKLTRDGKVTGERFGICADAYPDETGEANALYIWCSKSLVDRCIQQHALGFRKEWVPWRDLENHDEARMCLRYSRPVACKNDDGWSFPLSELQGDLNCFLSALSGRFVTPQATLDNMQPTLERLGHDPSFISPRAIDCHRYPPPGN